MKTTSDCVNILLLTNRGSDNVGDQVIEACDISLLSAVMNNLNQKVKIHSHSAVIIGKYMKTKDPADLAEAEVLMEQSDLVLFGGAPMFNFLYQNFYERTAVIIELAAKYQKPVLFSAIGVEGYSDTNKKCQRLKKALNLDWVRQITTRDDFEALQNYRENENLVIDKVADPAVFTDTVFAPYRQERPAGEKKKIGIFILRQGGFTDNKVAFSKEEAAALWLDLIRQLEAKGYDYELLTSGHFADEAFLDHLIRKYGVSEQKCVFNINSPERLIGKISSFDAVVSCRLHPSIISFALDVPSVGIVWNQKVTGFYNSVGYEDRVFETEGISAAQIVNKLEQIMREGVKKDPEFLMSVYNTLFYGIRNALALPDEGDPYTYEQLLQQLPPYSGTSHKEQQEKLQRKFRRAYGAYNSRVDKIKSLRQKAEQLEADNQRLRKKFLYRCYRKFFRKKK